MGLGFRFRFCFLYFLGFVAEGVCDICRPFRFVSIRFLSEMLRKIPARWWLFGSERVDFSSCKRMVSAAKSTRVWYLGEVLAEKGT